MSYKGQERRKFPRIDVRFIVSYRIITEPEAIDMTQTKNISLGGMLFATKRQFAPGTKLALEIRLPFESRPVMLVGRVIESQEVTKGHIYDTRLEFLKVDNRHKEAIAQTVDFYSKRSSKPGE